MATNSGGWLYETNGTPVDKATADNAQARVLEIKQSADTASTDAAKALQTANAYAGQIAQANTTAGEAKAIAQGAEDTADNAAVRVAQIEVMAGLAPGEVTDAQTANLISQPNTSTRAAMEAASVQIRDTRTVDAPGFGMFFPEAHGAVGDGTTDDTAALNATVQAAYAAGGGTVHLAAGATYGVTANVWDSIYSDAGGVAMLDGTSLFLPHGSKILALAPRSSIYKIVRAHNKTGVHIYGQGIIDGNKAASTATSGEWGYGVAVNGGKDITIEGVTAMNCWGDGFNVQRLSHTDYTQPENVTIRNVAALKNRRQGSSIEAVKGLLVEGCLFADTAGALPATGMDLEPADPNGVIEDVVIRRNRFKDNARAGLQALESTKIRNLTIEHNEFDGNGAEGNVPQFKIIMGGPDLTVHRNTFKNTHGTLAASIAGPSVKGEITENLMDADLLFLATGIIGGLSRGTRIHKNTLSNGIIRAGGLMNFAITENYISPRPGLDGVLATGASLIHGQITGNTITGGRHAVNMNNSNRPQFVDVKGNTCIHTEAEAILSMGLDITIEENIFEGCCLTSGDSIIRGVPDNNGAGRHKIRRNHFKKDPRPGTTATNTPLYTYRSEAILIGCNYTENTRIGLAAFPVDQAAGGGTILAADGVIPARATAYRPTGVGAGQQFYDTTLGRTLTYSGTGWRDAAGAPA